MIVGIVGLGLIGGSLAKAYKKAGMAVYAADIDASVMQFALLSGAADGALTAETLPACDLVLIALTPEAAEQWLEANAAHIAAHTLVMDCCGTKRRICETGFACAAQYGFTFVGGHPRPHA
jgi:prephenate dehydrogenase